MTLDQINAWILAASTLVNVLRVSVPTIMALMRSAGLTLDEQDQILDSVIADARRRKDAADAASSPPTS